MTLELTDNDHNTLDKYLNKVLDAYKHGEMDLLSARSEIAHVITSAAIDNVATMAHVRAFLETDLLEDV